MKFPKFSATRIAVGIYSWSQVFIPAIALLSAFASAVRTFQTTAAIYKASGSADFIIVLVALAFTVAVEGAIFFLALAQERQHIQWRQTKKRRNVMTVKTIWRAIRVRLGQEEPLTYDQMPESNMSLGLVIWIAFGFALTSNFYMGMRPLIEQLGAATVQSFISGLLSAPAHIQTDFIVDFASVIFPPFMALVAGKLTAMYASKMSGAVNRSIPAQETLKKTPAERIERVQSKAKPTPKLAAERIAEHLNANPADASLSQRQLAEKVGVSVGTVNAFKRSNGAAPTEQVSLNGNGRHE